MEPNQTAIAEIRRFNRGYTNILGLLNQHILDSSYSLTESRILLEIDKTPACTANELMAKLNVDKGYLSRILKRFEAAALLVKENSVRDGRAMTLRLTPEGKRLLTGLETKSDHQVAGLIRHLSQKEQERLLEAMRYIDACLAPGLEPVIIRSFQPEDIEYVIRRHREMYAAEYGFTPAFGDYVATTLSAFAAGRDPSRENLWIAATNQGAVGVIAVVKAAAATAQLRWFLIEPEMRGRKLGRRLIQTALDFCRAQGYRHVFLWTVSILGAARHLYRQYGFRLTETASNNTWTEATLEEERWDLEL